MPYQKNCELAKKSAQKTNPKIWCIGLTSFDEFFNEVIFRWGFNGHQIHAVFSADISGFEPINFVFGVSFHVARIKVAMVIICEGDWSWKIEKKFFFFCSVGINYQGWNTCVTTALYVIAWNKTSRGHS